MNHEKMLCPAGHGRPLNIKKVEELKPGFLPPRAAAKDVRAPPQDVRAPPQDIRAPPQVVGGDTQDGKADAQGASK